MSFIDSTIDWAGNKINQTDTVQALRTKAREWAASVVKLKNTPVAPALQKDKDALLSRAKTIKSMVEKIFGVMPEFAQLGVLPAVVPVVAVAAAATAIANWYFSYNTLVQNNAQYSRMVADGVAPAQAAAITSQLTQSTSITGNLAKIVPWLVIGGVAYFLLVKKRL